MPTRTAKTIWNGAPDETGEIRFVTSSAPTVTYTRTGRTNARANGSVTPEELLAAAHASCFALELSSLIGGAGGAVQQLDVTADATLSEDRAGRTSIDAVVLEVTGEVSGLSAGRFRELADSAGHTCPMSRALADVVVTVEASIDSVEPH